MITGLDQERTLIISKYIAKDDTLFSFLFDQPLNFNNTYSTNDFEIVLVVYDAHSLYSMGSYNNQATNNSIIELKMFGDMGRIVSRQILDPSQCHLYRICLQAQYKNLENQNFHRFSIMNVTLLLFSYENCLYVNYANIPENENKNPWNQRKNETYDYIGLHLFPNNNLKDILDGSNKIFYILNSFLNHYKSRDIIDKLSIFSYVIWLINLMMSSKKFKSKYF
ncbi:unnamed protein product [Gordionus sp. m RMFG-2023]